MFTLEGKHCFRNSDRQYIVYPFSPVVIRFSHTEDCVVTVGIGGEVLGSWNYAAGADLLVDHSPVTKYHLSFSSNSRVRAVYNGGSYTCDVISGIADRAPLRVYRDINGYGRNDLSHQAYKQANDDEDVCHGIRLLIPEIGAIGLVEY